MRYELFSPFSVKSRLQTDRQTDYRQQTETPLTTAQECSACKSAVQCLSQSCSAKTSDAIGINEIVLIQSLVMLYTSQGPHEILHIAFRNKTNSVWTLHTASITQNSRCDFSLPNYYGHTYIPISPWPWFTDNSETTHKFPCNGNW